jgi:large subunit ribosomal protein L3
MRTLSVVSVAPTSSTTGSLEQHQQQQQRRAFTVTPTVQKIHSINSDLSEDEIRKIIDDELQKMADEKVRKEYRNWKPGQRKRPLVVSYRLEDFEEEESGVASRWTLRDKRCGALGIKLGMMPVWDGWGERHPCTVLYLDSNVVLRNKTREGIEGYDAVEIGAGERKAKNVTKPLLGHYAKFGVADHPPYVVREFRVTTNDAMPPPGTRIHARHFIPGQNVDVSGITKGKGFQGGMKRHGFKGMPASHGTSRSHRAIGSTVS